MFKTKPCSEAPISPLYEMGANHFSRKKRIPKVNLLPKAENKWEGMLLLLNKGEVYREVNPDLFGVYRLACHTLNIKIKEPCFQSIKGKNNTLDVYRIL